jgi:hypothetical protein
MVPALCCFNVYRCLDWGTPDGEGKEHADLLDRQPANPARFVKRFGDRDPYYSGQIYPTGGLPEETISFSRCFCECNPIGLFPSREVSRMGAAGNMGCFGTTEYSEDPTDVELALLGKTKTETIASACTPGGYPPQPADGIVAS